MSERKRGERLEAVGHSTDNANEPLKTQTPRPNPPQPVHVDRMKVDPLSSHKPKLLERLPPDSPKIGKQEREGWATYVEISEPHTMAECPFLESDPPQPVGEEAWTVFIDEDSRLYSEQRGIAPNTDRMYPLWLAPGKTAEPAQVVRLTSLTAAERRADLANKMHRYEAKMTGDYKRWLEQAEARIVELEAARVVEADPLVELLERVLQELRAMDRQIDQEWGDGFYEPDPIIGELEGLLQSLRAPKATEGES